MMMAKPTATTMIKAVPKPITYVSVIAGGGGVGVGEACGASSTFMYVCATELPYAAEPSNEAIIVYIPGTDGVNDTA